MPCTPGTITQVSLCAALARCRDRKMGSVRAKAQLPVHYRLVAAGRVRGVDIKVQVVRTLGERSTPVLV